MIEALKKSYFIDIIINIMAGAIVTLGTLVFSRLFPGLNSNLLSLIASIVAIFVLWMIHYFRIRGPFTSEPVLLPLTFAMITILAIWVLVPTESTRIPPAPTYTPTNTPTNTPTSTPTSTSTNTPTPTPVSPAPCIGRSPGTPESLSVYPDYDPSGYMGHIDDIINVDKRPEVVRFTYEVKGRMPCEWEWKYKVGKPNPDLCQFAGVMYLYPPNNWGREPGLDLRQLPHAITWEARSLLGEVNVEFVIGGINWVWDEEKKVRVTPPCPDSLRRKSLGIRTLTEQWQSFVVELSGIPEEEFVNVTGGFGWIITWGSNDMQLNEERTGPKEPKTFEIEIRNIRYGR